VFLKAQSLALAMAGLLWVAAAPEEGKSREAGGYSFSTDQRGRLLIRRGVSSAPVPGLRTVYAITALRSGADKSVSIDWQDYCGLEHLLTLRGASIDAYLANAAALGPHRRGRYEEAAKGFSRAVALDPGFDLAATNLASAQTRLGRTALALETLAPLLARAPFRIYAKVMSDPDLEPLWSTPTLTALAARQPGSPAIAPSRKGHVELSLAKSGVLVAGERGWVATLHEEQSWGSCAFASEILVHDGRTGDPLGQLPILDQDDTEPDCERSGIRKARRAAVEKRMAIANRVLIDFGFQPARPTERGVVEGEDAAQDGVRVRFPGAALLVEITEGKATIRRDGKPLRTLALPEMKGIWRAIRIASPPVLVLAWSRPGKEGCEGTDPTGVLVIPVPG
jgi:hypothetical protein